MVSFPGKYKDGQDYLQSFFPPDVGKKTEVKAILWKKLIESISITRNGRKNCKKSLIKNFYFTQIDKSLKSIHSFVSFKAHSQNDSFKIHKKTSHLRNSKKTLNLLFFYSQEISTVKINWNFRINLYEEWRKYFL